jgi:hypothetical protein
LEVLYAEEFIHSIPLLKQLLFCKVNQSVLALEFNCALSKLLW